MGTTRAGWLAAEMSPGGLAVELFTSVPYGKRAILVAKASNVDEMFSKVNWDQATATSRRPWVARMSSSAESRSSLSRDFFFELQPDALHRRKVSDGEPLISCP